MPEIPWYFNDEGVKTIIEEGMQLGDGLLLMPWGEKDCVVPS